MDTETKICVRGLNLYYGSNHALKNINMDIPAGAVTAFIGPSGCGKSTFLKTLNRMNDLVPGVRIEGEVLLDGQEIYGPNVDTIALRQKVGMVFQQPNPFPMSIYDNVAYGPRVHGIRGKEKLDDIVEESLQGAAIWEEVKDRLKKSALGLSGGQQQRLCIARGPGGPAGGTADGRAHIRSGPHLYGEDRGPDGIPEEEVHGGGGYPQYAAGHPCFGLHRLLPAGRPDRIRRNKTGLLLSETEEDRGLYHGEIWLMRLKFDEQLKQLGEEMTHMGSMIEQAIQDAVQALLNHDVKTAQRIMKEDDLVDQEQKKIENLCFQLLIQQQPVARDLRTITAAMKMVTDMERIGDHAADISELTVAIANVPCRLPGENIKKMAAETMVMLVDAVDSYVNKDVDKAHAVIVHDDIVDDYFVKVKADLIEVIRRNPEYGEYAADLLLVNKYLERIGDHATNIAEWVIFALNNKGEG